MSFDVSCQLYSEAEMFWLWRNWVLLLKLLQILRVIAWTLWRPRSMVSRMYIISRHCRYVWFGEVCSSHTFHRNFPLMDLIPIIGFLFLILTLRFTQFGWLVPSPHPFLSSFSITTKYFPVIPSHRKDYTVIMIVCLTHWTVRTQGMKFLSISVSPMHMTVCWST